MESMEFTIDRSYIVYGKTKMTVLMSCLAMHLPLESVGRRRNSSIYADLQQALSVIPPRECYIHMLYLGISMVGLGQGKVMVSGGM